MLKRHGFEVSEKQVLETIENPEVIDLSRSPLFIHQKSIDRTHVLRVVCKKDGSTIKVITFYPGRKKMYEKR